MSSSTGGMGLGLLLARRIVESHGGRIVVESDTSSGTEITITLPRQVEINDEVQALSEHQ
jgi:signal transduction histidine kinase